MTSKMEKIVDLIDQLARRGDCKGLPHVSITFDHETDTRRFEESVRRDIEDGVIKMTSIYPINVNEMLLRGVVVRIVR
jgi:cytochrome oxidase Cu insertion factor (SCO1/SenC/PrrC family)